jgi:hypothetical protein
MEHIVGRYYRVRRRIGAGSFGEIYSGEDVRNHRRVALKFEQFRARRPTARPPEYLAPNIRPRPSRFAYKS